MSKWLLRALKKNGLIDRQQPKAHYAGPAAPVSSEAETSAADLFSFFKVIISQLDREYPSI